MIFGSPEPGKHRTASQSKYENYKLLNEKSHTMKRLVTVVRLGDNKWLFRSPRITPIRRL